MSDELFEVSTGAYGTTGFRLPGDEPPASSEIPDPGMVRKSVGMRRAKQVVDGYERARHDRIVREIPAGTEFVADLIRDRMGDNIVPPAAWGSLLNAAAKAGLVRKTGEYRASLRPERNGSVVAVWVRLP